MALKSNNPATSSVRLSDHDTTYDNPAYKKLSRINGDINKLTKEQMKEKLVQLHLDSRGQKDVLKKRLKSYYKRKYIVRPGISKPKGPDYCYFIVIDFEATCEGNTTTYPHEIIEFPAVLVNAADGAMVDTFHSFVRPTKNSRLTEFCKTLTDITQEQVNVADTFPVVLKRMEDWMQSHHLGKHNRFGIVTDGPWDMARFMYMQCLSSEIPYPRWAKRWVNIRKTFCNAYQTQRSGVSKMLEILGLTFEGRPHSGIDDAKNIARILEQLIADGCSVYENEKLCLPQAASAAAGPSGSTQDADISIVPPDDDDDDDDSDEPDAAAESNSPDDNDIDDNSATADNLT